MRILSWAPPTLSSAPPPAPFLSACSVAHVLAPFSSLSPSAFHPTHTRPLPSSADPLRCTPLHLLTAAGRPPLCDSLSAGCWKSWRWFWASVCTAADGVSSAVLEASIAVPATIGRGHMMYLRRPDHRQPACARSCAHAEVKGARSRRPDRCSHGDASTLPTQQSSHLAIVIRGITAALKQGRETQGSSDGLARG